MKLSNIKWRKELDILGIKYKQVNFVHDEFQTEVWGDRVVAEEVGKIQAAAIVWAGQQLGITCPLSGDVKIGRDWLETH